MNIKGKEIRIVDDPDILRDFAAAILKSAADELTLAYGECYRCKDQKCLYTYGRRCSCESKIKRLSKFFRETPLTLGIDPEAIIDGAKRRARLGSTA